MFVPLGERPGFWTPATVGSNFEFTPILKPIEKFREHVTVVSELCDPLDGHATTVSAWLSGAIPKKTFAEDVYSGETVDQVIARKIGQETPLPSLELATEDFTGYIGGCDTQYSCAYMNTISWSSATTPVPMEINPRVVFERLFGRPGTAAQRQQRRQTDKSILDSLTDDVKDLERGLGARDQGRLSEYLDHVREVERRIQMSEKAGANSLLEVDAPFGIPESWEEHARLMFELAALAYQADITRVTELHDGEGRQHDLVHEPGHLRAASLDDASPGATGEHPEPGEDQHVSHEPLRRVHREAQHHARRRRLAAGSLPDPLRQRDERGEHTFPAQYPHAAGRWSRRRIQGQPSHQDRGGDAVCELPVDARQHLRVRARALRNAEHGRAVALNEAL